MHLFLLRARRVSDPRAREIPGQGLATIAGFGKQIAAAAEARGRAWMESLYWNAWDAGRKALVDSRAKPCDCREWTALGRLSGAIRNSAGGWRLVGWRATRSRTEEPHVDAVNEVAFLFCPWCGSGLRPSGNEGGPT